MGYTIRISRCDEHPDPNEISLEEWQACVDAHPDLEWIDPEENPSAKVFHLARLKGEEHSWLAWSSAGIRTDYPDTPLMMCMLRLAEKFGAKVSGDDGECYVLKGEDEPDREKDPIRVIPAE